MPRKFIQSVKYARFGIAYGLSTQRNLWIHLVIAILVLAAAIYLQIGLIEMCILILTSSFVIVVEMVNTALEEVVNIASPEKRARAKVVKDVAAGAVLLSAFCAIIIGGLVFIPKLMEMLKWSF